MLETLMALAFTSTAFEPDGAIPAAYTCQGKNVSVPLAWSGLPAGTATSSRSTRSMSRCPTSASRTRLGSSGQ